MTNAIRTCLSTANVVPPDCTIELGSAIRISGKGSDSEWQIESTAQCIGYLAAFQLSSKQYDGLRDYAPPNGSGR